MLGNGAADAKVVIGLGSAGEVLTSNGAGVPPTFQASGSGAYVLKAGDTMSGQLVIDATNPVPLGQFPFELGPSSGGTGCIIGMRGDGFNPTLYTFTLASYSTHTDVTCPEFDIITSSGAADAFYVSGSGTITGNWVVNGNVQATTFNGGALPTGTVTSASVVSANGFGGSVATATTTPAITLTTSISGMLKGSASALTAAVNGTDYVNPDTAIAYAYIFG